MRKRDNRHLAIITLISVMLVILNYHTNRFTFVWCVYPIAISYGIYLINRYIK